MKRGNNHNENPFELDKDRLDDEWLAQPLLMDEYSQALVEARYEAEKAKDNLKLIEATVAAKIRKQPDRYGVLKVTDKAITDAVLVSEDYCEAVDDYRDARYQQEVCQAKVDSLEHRKKALENLVWLFGQQYFSSPSAKKATPEAIEKVRESQDKKIKGVKPKHHDTDTDDD